MKAHRPGTRAKIAARLAEHKRLMDAYMAEGIPADEASRRAFEEVTKQNKRDREYKAFLAQQAACVIPPWKG